MGRIWQDVGVLARHLDTWGKDHLAYTGRRPRLVLASGGFDPLHRGHVRYIQSSARLGDRLVVVVNGDGFLYRKKGYAFMSLDERLEIVAAIAGVDHAVGWDDGSQFVDGALTILGPDVFAKGGDRSSAEAMAPCELAACERLGSIVAYGVGGSDKPQSSSALVLAFTMKLADRVRALSP